MASQTRSAGLGQSIARTGGATHWQNPTNIYTSNNVYATVNLDTDEESHWLRATTFGFEIPVGATIDGISMRFERKSEDGYHEDYSIKIVQNGTEQGTDHVKAVAWPLSDAYETYGSSIDKWGLSWSPEQINADNFGVSVCCIYTGEESGCKASVDHVEITVYYTVPGTNMKINVGDAWKDISEIQINVGDSWKTVTKVQINIGDSWKTVFG